MLWAAHGSRLRLALGQLGTGHHPMLDGLKCVPDPGSGATQRLDDRDISVSSFQPTLDDASEKKRNVCIFSPFQYIGGWRGAEENKPNPANLLDILERITKMKLSPSLSRTASDSPCYRLCCDQLKREKKLCWNLSYFPAAFI